MIITKINHQYELEQIINSIFIFDRPTTKLFYQKAGINEIPCVAVQGIVQNPELIKDIRVYYWDTTTEIYEATQCPMGDALNPYSFDNFRFTLDDIENSDRFIFDQISIEVTFTDGEVFNFHKKLTDYTFFNKQLTKIMKSI